MDIKRFHPNFLVLILFSAVTLTVFNRTAQLSRLIHKWVSPRSASLRCAALSKGSISGIAYSPDGMLHPSELVLILVMATRSQQLVGKELKLIASPTNGITSVSFSPDGRTIAGGSGNGIIVLWDVDTANTQKQLH